MEKYTTNPFPAGQEIEKSDGLDTLGGEFGLNWNDTVPLTTGAYNAFLSAFFEAGGVFDHLVDTCPLRLTSNNAPTNRETLGTAIVGMTNGSYRYRHFDNLSGDAVTAELFGIRRLMSCDSVRRNLKAIPMEAGIEWIWNANLHLVEALLDQDYILDMDPTVKPLYGHQEGAAFGYNPQKPGRPSHCYHAFCIAKLRLVLGVVVHAGNETAGVYSAEMLDRFLKWLSGRLRPKLVRGDVGFGNEVVIRCCETNRTHYLFKVKRTKNIREIFQLHLAGGTDWEDAGDGWQCVDTRVILGGWSRPRRVLLVRRPMEDMKKRRNEPPHREFAQLMIPGLELVTVNDGMYADGYEWYALVTDLDLDPRAVSQLYRDRGDCENIFDEMKNHYGWGGFVTQDMKRTAIVAGLSAFVANVWNIFCRIGGDGSHKEAITTRRRLQGCVARISRHGRRNSITVYTAGKEDAASAFSAIAGFLRKVTSASQLKVEQRWQLIIYWAFRKYKLIYRLYPPLLGDQIMLPLA